MDPILTGCLLPQSDLLSELNSHLTQYTGPVLLAAELENVFIDFLQTGNSESQWNQSKMISYATEKKQLEHQSRHAQVGFSCKAHMWALSLSIS